MFQSRCCKICPTLPEGRHICIQYKGQTYAVYEDGRVWSFRRMRLLKHDIDQDGYPRVFLQDTHVRLGRLVCFVFNGPSAPSYRVVRHLDGNPMNSYPSNLKWGTEQENWDDRRKHNRVNAGKRCTGELVLAVRRKYMLPGRRRYYAQKFSVEFGISTQTIYHICTLKTWNEPQYIPENYTYENN